MSPGLERRQISACPRSTPTPGETELTTLPERTKCVRNAFVDIEIMAPFWFNSKKDRSAKVVATALRG